MVNMIFDDSRWHRVDHVHQVLAALGKTCRSGVLETGMRLKLQLLAPSQAETPITTVVVVGRTSMLDGIIEQHNTDPITDPAMMGDTAGLCTVVMNTTHGKIEGQRARVRLSCWGGSTGPSLPR